MADVSHFWGSDITVGPTGDIAMVSGDTYTQQRLVRRFLTAAGDYIQQLGYGAGLGGFVGQPGAAAQIAGVIRRQCRNEATVMQSPPPVVAIAQDATGNITATVTYVDAVTKQTAVATVPLTGS